MVYSSEAELQFDKLLLAKLLLRMSSGVGMGLVLCENRIIRTNENMCV